MFLEKFRVSIGVGMAVLILKLHKTCFLRGDTIEGTLTLEGGSLEQHIKRLFVTLSEYHDAGKNSHWETLDRVTAAEAILIAAHQAHEYTFRLTIPYTARITTSDHTPNSTQVVAEADILWSVNPSANFDIQITPDPEILVLDTALGVLGFTAVNEFFSSPVDRTLGAVQRTYTVRASLQDQITDVTLKVHVAEGQCCGILLLNHREIHPVDYLKAVVGADKEQVPFEILSEHLLGGQGLTFATTLLQQLLAATLKVTFNNITS